MAQDPQPVRRNYSVFRENIFGIGPGGFVFEIATNLCDWFELGSREGADYWLEAQIVGGGEFLFNGRLFLRGQAAGTIIDNFPRATPEGWTRRQRVEGNGYELVSSDGAVLFGYRVDGRVCRLTVNIFDSKDEIVAECSPEELRVYRPPMKIGRGGVVWA